MDYYNYQSYINSNNSHLPYKEENFMYYNYPSVPPAFQNYPPTLNYDAPMKLPDMSPVPLVETKSDDELWIETWLSKIGKIHINLDSTIEIIPTEKKRKSTVKKPLPRLGTIKSSLQNCLKVIKKLQDTKDLLEKNVDTFTTKEWQEKTIEIGALKDEFSKMMPQFENRESILTILKAIKMRKKKRRNKRSRKLLQRDLMSKKHERSRLLNKNIDEWLESMKDATERIKMEENMKKDADCVLAEVTKKKSDARKHLSLITSLIKLRAVREQVAQQRGEKMSLEDHNAFSLITGHLLRMWENSMQVYSKEETGLKVMLEQNAIEDSKATSLAKERSIVRDWEFALFGPKTIPSPAYWGLTASDKNMETFIAIRRSWDTFLTPPGETGSKIPIGWVLPNPFANEDWRKYLQA